MSDIIVIADPPDLPEDDGDDDSDADNEEVIEETDIDWVDDINPYSDGPYDDEYLPLDGE